MTNEMPLSPENARMYDPRASGGRGTALEYEAVWRALRENGANPRRVHVECAGMSMDTTVAVGLSAKPFREGNIDVLGDEEPTRPDDVVGALEANGEFSIRDVTIHSPPTGDEEYALTDGDDPTDRHFDAVAEAYGDLAPMAFDLHVGTIVEVECIWERSPAFNDTPDAETYRADEWGENERRTAFERTHDADRTDE